MVNNLDEFFEKVDIKVSHDKIYKLDNKEKTRVWWVEQDNEKYSVKSGILNGAIVSSEWTICKSTNVGKTNERDSVEQCTFEINSLYNDKLSSGGYTKDISKIGQKLYFEPMLAKKWEDLKQKDKDVYIKNGAIVSRKLDGTRCIATSSGLQSREGKSIVSVPHISEILNEFLSETGVVLDGELYNHRFKDDFNKIISLVRKTKPTDLDLEESRNYIQYWIYDCFDPSRPYLKYSERYDIIEKLVQKLNNDTIQLVKSYFVNTHDELDDLYALFQEEGYEGQMLRYDMPYENKRSKFLLKRKEFQDEEFKIVEIHEGIGNWSGYAKAVEFKIDETRTAKAGIRGSQEFAKKLLEEANEYIGGTITVRFQNKTPDGIPRFPVSVAFYKGERNL